MGIKVMQHGKDYMVDKPGLITLEQLEEVKKVQAETGQIYSVCYSERFWSRAATKADELIQAGAIGKVIQTLSMGPHQRRLPIRPDWFFVKEKYGGISNRYRFPQFRPVPAFHWINLGRNCFFPGIQLPPSPNIPNSKILVT